METLRANREKIPDRAFLDIRMPEKMMGNMNDISVRERVEKELYRARYKAEESDRLITSFFHYKYHETGTPSTVIGDFAVLLSEPGLGTKTQQSYIEILIDFILQIHYLR
jgi:hypothetical protein